MANIIPIHEATEGTSPAMIDMIVNGEWPGAEIVTIELRGTTYALNGAHRLAACKAAGAEPRTISLQDVAGNFGEDVSAFIEAVEATEGDFGTTTDLLVAAGIASDSEIAPAIICRHYGIDFAV